MSTLTTPLNGSGIVIQSIEARTCRRSVRVRRTADPRGVGSASRELVLLLLRWLRSNLDFLEGRVRGLMSLSLAAELGKPLRHSAGFVNGSQDSDCCLAAL